MKKKIVAVLSVLVLMFSLSSCGSKVEYYTDENEKNYLVVRDSDNNIVINDSGKLQVYMLNENGKKEKSDSGDYITEYIDFNGQVIENRNVETAEMRFTIPVNFVADFDNPGYFSYDNYDVNEGEIFFHYMGDITMENDMKAIEKSCEDLLESFGSENFSYEKYSITVGTVDCTVYKQICTSSEYYKTVYFYYIPYDEGFYSVNCNVNTDYGKKINFDKFVKTIELK